LTSTPAQPPSLAVKTSGLAIAALIIGILSIFSLGLTAIPAIILGIISLVKIEKSGGRLTGRGFAIGGIVVPVVAVPILLMIILMPALQRVKKQARSVACMSRLKQWGLLFLLYAEDYDGRFMLGHRAQPLANRWVSALGDYYKWDDEFTCCPNATKPWIDEFGVNSGALGRDVGVTMAWGYMKDDHWPKQMKGSYGINGWCVDTPPGREPHGEAAWYWRGPNVAGAEYVPLFLGSQRYNGWVLHTDRPPAYSGERWNDDAQIGRYCLNRHQGYVNCLFMDYSVRKVGLKELWTLKWHRNYNTNGSWTRSGGVQPTDWPPWMRNFRDY
jgi:hypothetical protein